MTIELNCKCGHRFEVPEGARGTLAACPACGGRIFVPTGAASDSLPLDSHSPVPDEAGDLLASDEMLALRDEEGAERVEREGLSAEGEGPPGGARAPGAAPAGETELAAGPEEVLAGPEDSVLAREGAGRPGAPAGGFAVRFEEEPPQPERPRFERCPQCDAQLEEDARVCTNCGYDLFTGERIRQVRVEEGGEAAEVAAEVGLGLAAFLAVWVVKLRYALLAAAAVAAAVILGLAALARHERRTGYQTKISGGGLVFRLMEEAQRVVEEEAFDLERRKQQEVEMALVKLNREPRAEEGVFSDESRFAARQAYLRAREAYVIERDPAKAERILEAMLVLYGPMEPWGRRAREELQRVRTSAAWGGAGGPASASRPASPPTPPATTHSRQDGT